MYAMDKDLPMTCFWLVDSKRFDVNKMYRVGEQIFSIFQYSIYMEYPNIALSILEEYEDVMVLNEDGKGRTVLDYRRPLFTSAAIHSKWLELDQKLWHKADREKESLKRKRISNQNMTDREK